MDKIPLEQVKESEKGKLSLFGIYMSKCDYANIEKTNQLIDWCRELQEDLFKVKGK